MPITEAHADCRQCGHRFSYEQGRRGRRPIYCSPECCTEWNRVNLKPLPAVECRHCGKAFHPARIAKRYQGIREIYCSAACRGLSQRKPEQAAENARKGSSRRRALKKGAKVEDFTHAEVYERDRWKCGLCGKRVDKRLRYPDPMSASLDHIVPLCDGGEHSLRNSQCSHWICNSRKTFGAGGQMRLFG